MIPDETESLAGLMEYWPLVKKMLEDTLVRLTARCAQPGQTPNVEELRLIQGQIMAYQAIRHWPEQRMKQIEEERHGGRRKS